MGHFNNIVYILSDHIDESSPSLVRAIALAKSNQADLTLLQILPDILTVCEPEDIHVDETQLQQTILTRETERLEKFVAKLDTQFHCKTEQVSVKRYFEIIRLVQTHGYDLVIKEVEEVDWLDRLLGSDDMHLLRKCPCPVWLMTKDEKPEYKHIIAAVDFDDDDKTTCNEELNAQILKYAGLLSLAELTTLHVVNVYDVPQAGFISQWVEQPDKVRKELYNAEYLTRRTQMNTLIDELKQTLGEETFNFIAPVTHLVQGRPDRELPKLAKSLEADLVVMGTVSRVGFAKVVIGNTAETVLSQLDCSVLTVKPKGFVAPDS